MPTALVTEVLEALKKEVLPEEWTFGNAGSSEAEDGYVFLRKNRIIVGCIIDVAIHKRAKTTGKGPLTLEKYKPPPGEGWTVLCDADTPDQVVAAFITYVTFGEFNDL